MIRPNKHAEQICIETPVLLIGFNRPDKIYARLNELQKVKLKHLHISIDYFDDASYKEHKSIIEKARNSFPKESFSYELKERNLGLTGHVTSEISKLFTKYENLIIIEDDVNIPNENLKSLSLGLIKYGDINGFGAICGFSPLSFGLRLGKFNFFRKSSYFACWGWGTKKSVWENYVADLSELDLNAELGNSKIWKSLTEDQQAVWLGRFNKVKQNPSSTWDIQFQFMTFRYDYSNIVPCLSLVENEGFEDDRAVHTKGSRPFWMRTNDISRMPKIYLISNNIFTRALSLIDELTLVGDRSQMINWLKKIRMN